MAMKVMGGQGRRGTLGFPDRRTGGFMPIPGASNGGKRTLSRAAAKSAEPGPKDQGPIEGTQAGSEQVAASVTPPAPGPTPPAEPLPVAGTFSRPGQGRAKVIRRARFGGNPFAVRPERGLLNRSVRSAFGFGTTSPRGDFDPNKDKRPRLRSSLARALRR